MYGVRIMIDGEIADLKIFEGLPHAQARFRQGRAQAYDGEFDSIALFRVLGAPDVREAAEAIRSGDRDHVELLDMQESREAMIAKVAKQIRIEL